MPLAELSVKVTLTTESDPLGICGFFSLPLSLSFSPVRNMAARKKKEETRGRRYRWRIPEVSE